MAHRENTTIKHKTKQIKMRKKQSFKLETAQKITRHEYIVGK